MVVLPFFYVTGRKDDLVKVGGHRINPREVEDALMATGRVIEAAVIGLPDDLLGSSLAALAVPKDSDISEQTILRQCRSRLPKYKMPESIQLFRALPKNASGKVDKAKCFELLN